MAVRITKFAGEFAALTAWTGESEQQLRTEEDYHTEEREHWGTWAWRASGSGCRGSGTAGLAAGACSPPIGGEASAARC